MELKDLGATLLVALGIVAGLLGWALPNASRHTRVIGVSACLVLLLIAMGLILWEPTVSPKQVKQAETERIVRVKQAESETLGKLVAGVTVSSFRRTLGQDAPDYKFSAPGQLTREVYVRDYDYVQAWVDRKQDVASFSVTIRTEDFHPVLRFAGQPIVLGQDSIAKASGGPYTLGGGCGHSGHYYEAFGGSAAEHSQFAAVGFAVIGAGNNRRAWNYLCDEGEAGQMLLKCNLQFLPGHPWDSANSGDPSCFTESSVGKRFRQDAIANVFAISAPGRTLPEETEQDSRLAPHHQEIS
jgi:hypothetical protein